MRQASRGFTIIELMLSVTIVATLVALALPAYQNYSMRTKVSEAFTLSVPVKRKLVELYIQDGAFPADNAAASLNDPSDYGGKYVGSISVVTNGVIVVTFSDIALAGQTVTFAAIPAGRTITWGCASSLPPAYLPRDCR